MIVYELEKYNKTLLLVLVNAVLRTR